MTTAYVRAPERILGTLASTTAIDFWAFGVQVLCLHTGSCPWIAPADTCKPEEFVSHLIGVIGPITDESWPQHRELPLWSRVESLLRPQSSAPAFRSPSVHQVAFSSLQWCPGKRATWPQLWMSTWLRPFHLATCTLAGSVLPQAVAQVRCDSESTPTVVSRATPQPHSTDSVTIPVPSPPSEGKLCGCSGQCGSRVHKSVGNKLQRSKAEPGTRVCNSLALPGFSKCGRCKCEIALCSSYRSGCKGDLRWCKTHNQTLLPTQYATPDGVFQLKKSWSVEIKLLARMGHLLNLATPTDLTYFLRAFRSLCPVQIGKAVDPFKFCLLFVAHLIKWPTCVRFFLDEAARLESRQSIDIVRLIRRTVVFAAGVLPNTS